MGKTNIPVDITFEHYIAVRSILQHVLQDIESAVGDGAKWVTCRLNQSGEKELKAFFLGWLENEKLKAIRISQNHPDPGLFRFLDDVDTPTYKNTLGQPKQVHKQVWGSKTTKIINNPSTEPLYLYLDNGYFKLPADHEICRLSIAIKVGDHYVGTLNTGLSQDPGTKINNKMMEWGQNNTSELVQYLKNEFELGGPTV